MRLSGENFGVSEEKIIERQNIEKETEKENENVLEELIAQIKAGTETIGHATVAVNKLPQKFNLTRTTQKNELVYLLKGNENIVTEKKTVMKNGEALKEENESATTPIFYRYVSKEEKEKLGFRANVFPNLNDEMISLLEKTFPKMKNPKKINKILHVFDYLVKAGAMQNWIEIHISAISSSKGASLDDVLFAMRKLMKKKLLVAATLQKRKNGTAIVCHLAKSKQEFDELAEYVLNNDNINIQQPFAKERKKLKSYATESVSDPMVAKEIIDTAYDNLPFVPKAVLSSGHTEVHGKNKEQTKKIYQIAEHILREPELQKRKTIMHSTDDEHNDTLKKINQLFLEYIMESQKKDLLLEERKEEIHKLEDRIVSLKKEKDDLEKRLREKQEIPEGKYLSVYKHYVNNGLMDIMGAVFNGIERIAATPPRERYNDMYWKECKSKIGKDVMQIVSNLKNVSSDTLSEMIMAKKKIQD